MAKKASGRKKNTKTNSSKSKEERVECGLVMPISEIGGCDADHWEQVREIIEEALNGTKIKTSMVSDADEVGVIQDRIVKNLYQNPIVVCDVSCKNPNVMFELGLRLAFDKPTVVIKDDKTSYSFDTSPIEHIPYPRNLNYRGMVKFKKVLKQKVEATLKAAAADSNYSSFLSSFTIKNLVGIDTENMTPSEFYSSELNDLKKMISRLTSIQSRTPAGTRINPALIPKAFKANWDHSDECWHLLEFRDGHSCALSDNAMEDLLEWHAKNPSKEFFNLSAESLEKLMEEIM